MSKDGILAWPREVTDKTDFWNQKEIRRNHGRDKWHSD
jgi:hypothetical protein